MNAAPATQADDTGAELSPQLSYVIPLLNESPSLAELYRRIREASESLGRTFEIVFVDDGSTDDSFAVLKELHLKDGRVRVLRFGKNRGKSDALEAGFRAARGEVVVTMDADLQDDPSEVPRMLEALAQGDYDMVSGWKQDRRDRAERRVLSRIFNWVTRTFSGIPLHDFNCGFKVYRKVVTDHLSVYGEMHRFLPVMAHWQGFRVGELGVVHHARRHGTSRYGAGRILKGLFDFVTVMFLVKFEKRPLHLFGAIGLMCLLLGGGISVFFVLQWMFGAPMYLRPIMIGGWVLILVGVQFFSMGLLGEMLARGHHQHREVPVQERLG